MQGLLEMLGLPYVGAGVLGSAADHGQGVVQGRAARRRHRRRRQRHRSGAPRDRDAAARGRAHRLPLPSSSRPGWGRASASARCTGPTELAAALELAFRARREGAGRGVRRRAARSSAACSATTTPSPRPSARSCRTSRVVRLRGEVRRGRLDIVVAARRPARAPSAGGSQRHGAGGVRACELRGMARDRLLPATGGDGAAERDQHDPRVHVDLASTRGCSRRRGVAYPRAARPARSSSRSTATRGERATSGRARRSAPAPTLPPERITPTRSPRSIRPASSAASPQAPLGSSTIFRRSKREPHRVQELVVA